MRTARWLAAACGSVLIGLSPAAESRVEAQSLYSKAQTYNGALRYLRVDLGYEVTERDPEAAYLLFTYVPTGSGNPSQGAIEIVQTGERINVYVRLPRMPRYHEQVLTDGLLRKLREEYGEPVKRPRPEQAPAKGNRPAKPGAPGASEKPAKPAER